MIAGQGTIGLELAEQVPDAGTVVIPIGGGGLASGIALALRGGTARRADRRRAGCRHAARRTGLHDRRRCRREEAGRADVEHPRPRARRHRLRRPTRRSPSRSCCSSSGRSSSSRARARSASRRCSHGKVGGEGTVVPVLSGGNIDATLLISVMRRGLAVAGRFLVLRTRVPDRPGELATLLDAARQRARERRRGRAPARDAQTCPSVETGVELTLLTRDAAHCDEILCHARPAGATRRSGCA